MVRPDPFRRGAWDCAQDDMENCHFASTGGLDNRDNMTAPKYIVEADREEYLHGYITTAFDLYGADWRTCEFSWGFALAIND